MLFRSLYELEIPPLDGITTEDMLIRVRSAVIPQRAIEPIETNFMGMKQWYPGRTSFTHTITIDFEEFEDQNVTKYFWAWFEKMNKLDKSDQTGVATGAGGKKDIAEDIILRMYKYDGGEMEKKITFIKAYPESMADATLGYANNESLKHSITFRFDYWLLN